MGYIFGLIKGVEIMTSRLDRGNQELGHKLHELIPDDAQLCIVPISADEEVIIGKQQGTGYKDSIYNVTYNGFTFSVRVNESNLTARVEARESNPTDLMPTEIVALAYSTVQDAEEISKTVDRLVEEESTTNAIIALPLSDDTMVEINRNPDSARADLTITHGETVYQLDERLMIIFDLSSAGVSYKELLALLSRLEEDLEGMLVGSGSLSGESF